MACKVKLENKIILQATSGLIETLYYEFLEETQKKNIVMNTDLENFIDKLQFSYLTLGGERFDIAEIITSSKNLQTIISVLELVINNIKQELAPFALNDLWNFYFELGKYKEELEIQGK